MDFDKRKTLKKWTNKDCFAVKQEPPSSSKIVTMLNSPDAFQLLYNSNFLEECFHFGFKSQPKTINNNKLVPPTMVCGAKVFGTFDLQR